MSVHTIFFGGGTPSLLSPSQLRQVLGQLRSAFQVNEDAEITLEANPGTVSGADLEELRRAGINRISFGVQSANGEELRMLERIHDFGEVLAAFSSARRAGFNNLNADLIYGLPGQDMESWKTTVRRVVQLGTEHVSAYALTLEHGTPFGQWAMRGLLAMPDPDLAADMYEWLCDAMQVAGYRQYEISNWAKAARDCLHNLQYWRSDPYLGFGAGAHGYEGRRRYANVLPTGAYIERMTGSLDHQPNYPCSPASMTNHVQTIDDDMGEFMMMGLRLTREGVSSGRFHARFGRNLMDQFGSPIGKLVASGLLEWTASADGSVNAQGTVRLTGRGRLLGNRVFSEFVDSPGAA